MLYGLDNSCALRDSDRSRRGRVLRLIQFIRFDIGEVLRKECGDRAPRGLFLIAGNPLIMSQMVKFVPDEGSYAPVTIIIDDRTDGVHLSYDRMASFLASYGNAEALKWRRLWIQRSRPRRRRLRIERRFLVVPMLQASTATCERL
jgi:hypothetical protein